MPACPTCWSENNGISLASTPTRFGFFDSGEPPPYSIPEESARALEETSYTLGIPGKSRTESSSSTATQDTLTTKIRRTGSKLMGKRIAFSAKATPDLA
jgi:hypothetical protein